jgi:cell division protein ZapA (FtsZ GTPase activity inhibitor)
MPLVEIRIKKDTHQISCAEGEETKVSLIANKLKHKIEELSARFPSATDKAIYLMASLTVIDEIEESKGVLDFNAKEESTLKIIDEVSERIEKLVHKIESTKSNVIR